MSDQLSWQQLPTKPGVYIFRDQNNRVLYVGKAKDLRKRVYSYFSNKALEAKTIQLVRAAKKLDHIIVTSEIEAFFLEASLIKKYKPYYNVRMMDDKSYPLLKIGLNNGVPYLSVTHRSDEKTAKYFGPYAGITDLKIVLRILRRIFPYQSVKNHPPKRCLYNHLGLCPCISAYPEKLPEYKRSMRALGAFLNGGKDKVVKMLQREMKEYVRKEEFEEAGEIQKKIERINFITEEHYSPFQYEEKPDFYFQRIKSEIEFVGSNV